MRRWWWTAWVVIGLAAARAEAQAWNAPATQALVRRAVERRARQIGDTTLQDYTAVARGFLTFLGQFGEGFPEPPKVVRADELALEVYWRAPDRSKQWILGRRDTLLLPTDIQYHRDHLGIVQNNFPDIIRLGDGDEVRDVPHPLSGYGLEAYDFALTDSLTLRLGARTLDVVEVRVRPRDPLAPRFVGALYLDRADATVARMTFSFTRAALKDEQLEDVSVVLENGLVDGRFWLPRRQEIEIRRTGTWLDYPVRGIIRGTWDICCVQVNQGLPSTLFATGPEIAWAPPSRRAGFAFEGRLVDRLPPEARGITDAEARAVQEQARTLVRAQALRRADPPVLAARGISDVVRVTRVEGLAVGAGVSRRFGAGAYGRLAGRGGFADRRGKWTAEFGWRWSDGTQVALEARDGLDDASLVAERSGLANSLAAQEFASDASEPFRARGLRLTWQGATIGRSWHWRSDLGVERHAPAGRAVEGLAARREGFAVAGRGTHRPVLPAWTTPAALRLGVGVSHPTAPIGGGGATWRGAWRLESWWFGTTPGPAAFAADQPAWTGAAPSRLLRARSEVAALVPMPRGALAVRADAAAAWSAADVPPQFLTLLGGPVSAPGYALHQLAAPAGAALRAEWRLPVPGPVVPLGRYGRAGPLTLAPYAHVAWLGGRSPGDAAMTAWRQWFGDDAVRHGAYPSIGIAVFGVFDLVRLDVARGLRDGRWMLGLDVAADFWRIL